MFPINYRACPCLTFGKQVRSQPVAFIFGNCKLFAEKGLVAYFCILTRGTANLRETEVLNALTVTGPLNSSMR